MVVPADAPLAGKTNTDPGYIPLSAGTQSCPPPMAEEVQRHQSADRWLAGPTAEWCHLRGSGLISAVSRLHTQQWLSPGHPSSGDVGVVLPMRGLHASHHSLFVRKLLEQAVRCWRKKPKDVFTSCASSESSFQISAPEVRHSHAADPLRNCQKEPGSPLLRQCLSSALSWQRPTWYSPPRRTVRVNSARYPRACIDR